MGTGIADTGPAASLPRISRFSPAALRTHAKANTLALASLLAIGLLYIAALAFLPPQALTHHDEGAKYLQVRNLRLTPQGLDWSINYPARRLDPNLQFVPFHPKQHYVDGQGRIYLQWPIFLGLLTRIFWKVFGFAGLYVVPLAAGLGTLWSAYLLALQAGVERRLAWLAVSLVGLAAPVAIYSLLYFEHTLVCLLVALSATAAVAWVRRIDTPGWAAARPLLASGVTLGVAVYFRSELYLLALVLAAAIAVVAWRARALGRRALPAPLLWIGTFALSLVPLWAFYAITEGTLLPTHALWYFSGGDSVATGVPRATLPPIRYLARVGWGAIPAFLLGPRDAPLAPDYAPWVEWAGLLGTALCLVAAAARTRAEKLERIARTALPVFAAGLALVVVSTGAVLFSSQAYYNLHGFLLASPFIALALWPPRGGHRAGMFLYSVSLLYVGLHALVISALSGLGPISVHEWGQRYLLPAYPLLVAPALLAVQSLLGRPNGGDKRIAPTRVKTAVLTLGVALVSVGAGFTARGYAVLSQEREQVAEWLQVVATLPAGEPVVTDTWWLPLNLAAGFYSRPFMLAEGDGRLAEWAGDMRSRGVARFGLATADPAALNGEWTRRVPGLSPTGQARPTDGIWLQEYTLQR